MKVNVYNLKNEVTKEIDLPKSLFAAKWNPILVKQVLLAQMANKRRPWAHAKTRAEVRGGGRKPWRQKGTGRARHGSIRSPLWIGGGKSHGPNKERDYSQKVNKKMRRAAMLSILSKKLSEKEIKIFDSLELAEPKTKPLFAALQPMLAKTKRAKTLDVLMIPSTENKNLFRAARNLVKAKAVNPETLNVNDLLSYKNIFIDERAIGIIEKHYKIAAPRATTKISK